MARWGVLISLAVFTTLIGAPGWDELAALGAPRAWPSWSDAGVSYVLFIVASAVLLICFAILTNRRFVWAVEDR